VVGYTGSVMGEWSFTYDKDGNQVTEISGAGAWKHTNVYADGELLATYDPNGVHFAFGDWLGDKRIQVLSAASGAATTATLESTCWNLPFNDAMTCSGNGTDATEHHYTGKEHDFYTGLDLFGARNFTLWTGRFLSPDDDSSQDPFSPQSWNLYSYVDNNPLTNTDPDGHDCVTQTRTSDTSVSVTVTAGGCGSGGGTYVPGTVSSVTAGADGHSIDIGYTPYSDSSGGAVENIGAVSNGPKMDEGAVNPEGEGQLVGFAVGGAVGKMIGAAARGVMGWLGAGAGTVAGEAAGEVTGQFTLRIGGVIDQVIQTSAGPVRVYCDVTVEGTTAVVKDLLIYPADSTGSLDVGYSQMRQGIRALQQDLKAQGFDSMRVEDAYRISGANPGRSTTFTTKLR
jgi:RHS repeat-associated protein